MQKYIVFRCSKCEQYTYAKIDQKGKKCPRCRRNHKVEKLPGEIVEGPTAAMEKVRYLQNTIITRKNRTFLSSNPIVSFKRLNKKKEEKSKDKGMIKSNMEIFIEKIYQFQINENINSSNGFPVFVLDVILKDLPFGKTERDRQIIKNKLENLNIYSIPLQNYVFLKIK